MTIALEVETAIRVSVEEKGPELQVWDTRMECWETVAVGRDAVTALAALHDFAARHAGAAKG